MKRSRALGFGGILLAAVGCSGTVESPELDPVGTSRPAPRPTAGPGAPPATSRGDEMKSFGEEAVRLADRFFPSTPSEPTPARLWMLTNEQLEDTITQLFGAGQEATVGLDPLVVIDGYSNQAKHNHLEDRRAEQVATMGARLAAQVVKDPARFLPCRPADPANEPCVAQFVSAFGKRAFRRPLAVAEQERLLGLYRRARTDFGATTALRLTTEAVFRSLYFLFRTELGAPGAAAADGLVRLTPHEVASSLSYTLLGMPPDAELMNKADSGALTNTDEIGQQLTRLLGTEAARATFAGFVLEWMGVADVATVEKDRQLFPFWTPEVGRALRDETRLFAMHVFAEPQGGLAQLLTASHSFVARPLDSIYGNSVTSATAQKTALPPGQRAGLLTQGSFLAAHASSSETSPTLRGVYVLENLGCTIPPPPPENVEQELPKPSTRSESKRERFERHAKDSSCAGCHALFDPLGYALETYDAVGRHRTVDNGVPIDSAGRVSFVEGQPSFANAVELAQVLAKSPEVHQCTVRHLFRYLHGRGETTGDNRVLRAAFLTLTSGRRDLRQAIAAILSPESLLQRRASR